MATGFNLNDIVGFTDFIKSLNQSTAQVVGIDLLYFRAVPHKNSESLIFHEYTLLDVECEKQIKGVVKNTDYGNGVEIDLFGVKYDAPLQIQFDLITWIQVFGPNTMPQKDDIVYVPLLNRLFEVSSSTPIYTFINQQTAWQVDMVKYSPKASRAENALLAQTLEESTYSEATLFGDEISKQIADITDIKEFSPYNSVAGPGDWFKEVNNLDHIKNQNVVIRGFHISNGFYDMSSEDFGVSYKNSADNILDGNYRLFCCWFRPHESSNSRIQYEVSNLSLYLKSKGMSQFRLETKASFEIGEEILLTKGSYIQLSGTILLKEGNKYLVEFNTKDVLKANKKITQWQTSKGIKIESIANKEICLFSSANKNMRISIVGLSKLVVSVGDVVKSCMFRKSLEDAWYGFALNIGHTIKGNLFDDSIELIDNLDLGDIDLTNIEIDEYCLERSSSYMTNIRLYEFGILTEDIQSLEEEFKNDFSQNASACLIADKAEIPNKMEYLGKIR